MTEVAIRRVSAVVRLVDDLSAAPVTTAAVRLRTAPHVPVVKRDGFYAFADLPVGDYELDIDSPLHRPLRHPVSLPLPAINHPIIAVPGENELLLAVRTVDTVDTTTNKITFAPRTITEMVAAGAPVVGPALTTILTADLEGEGVDTAALATVGAGPTQLQPDDAVRILRDPRVRLRPGPLQDVSPRVRRVAGTVRDAVTGEPLAGATVALRRVNGITLTLQNVGPAASGVARVYSVGAGAAKRIVGTDRSVFFPVTSRGRYAFYFPPDTDLTVNSVSLRASAPDYVTGTPVDVLLTGPPHVEQALDLFPS